MREIVVYGLGELGQLYGAGALRAGIRVTPITRASEPLPVLARLSAEVPVLVAVDEAALDPVLSQLAPTRGRDLILLQNELFPSRWRERAVHPTVLVPWLQKKRGTPLLIARPTPVYGRHAGLVTEIHQALNIPSVELKEERALHRALVEKYAFILTINALGLLRDRTLVVWLQEDRLRVRALAAEAARLGAALCESQVDLPGCERAVEEAMHALGTISARGRTAQERLTRALGHAERLGLERVELARVVADAK